MKTNEELLAANAHIPTSDVLKDIADTEAEIRQMYDEADYLEKAPVGTMDGKLAHYRASGKRAGIESRIRFIAQLKSLLKLRKVCVDCGAPESGGHDRLCVKA